MTGPVAVEVLLGEHLLADLARLVPIVVAVLALFLFICFRNAAGVVVPLLEVFCLLVWALGGMALAGVPLTLVTAVLPVLLMTLGMTDEIHLIDRIFAHAARCSRPEAVLRAIREVGRPIVYTSLTTAIGFLGFSSASIETMRDFGRAATAGILLAMVFTFTLVPAALLLMPGSWWRAAKQSPEPWHGRFERWAMRRSRTAAAAAAIAVTLGATGIFQLRIQDSWVENFDPDSDIVAADARFEAGYWGTYRLDVVLESTRERFFFTPAGVALMDSLQRNLARLQGVGGTLSARDYLRLGLRGVDPRLQVRDLSEKGLAQLYLLHEASGMQSEMNHLVTADGRRTRILCWVRHADYARGRDLVARAQSLAREIGGPAVEVVTTGDLAVATRVVESTVTNQIRSLVLTFVGLAIVLAVSMRSLAATAVTLAPVTATILVVFGAMGYAGVPLGIATSMFAAQTLGVGVDFGIHFVSRYLDARSSSNEAAALSATLAGAGRAIRWNAVVLAAGFSVLTFSKLRPDRALGILLSAGIVSSFLMTSCLLPILLRRFCGRRGIAAVAAIVLMPLLAAGAQADSDGGRIMRDLEKRQRSGQRLFTMEIDLRLPGGFETRRRMIAVSRNDADRTRLLYVITEPEVFAGSSLLIHDRVDGAVRDRSWTYFPGLEAFREVESTSLRLLVPGTGLTYEDARGWIANDRYTHRVVQRSDEELTIESRPRTPEVARLVGASQLFVRVDPRIAAVTGVAFHDLAGNLVRTYEATAFVAVGDAKLPVEVRTAHRTQLLEASIRYRYLQLAKPPPAGLFEPTVEPLPFLERLQEWLRSMDIALDGPGWIAAPAAP